MTKHSIATLALTMTLTVGSLALATVDASAQRVGGKSSSTTPAGPPPVNGGSDDAFKVFLADTDCRQAAATVPSHCPKAPPPRIVLVDGVRCLDVDHPRSVLPWGQVMINQRKTKIKYCDNLHTMQ